MQATSPSAQRLLLLQRLQINAMSTRPLSLYLHTPFCERKCPYCDFNSRAIERHSLLAQEQRYATALCRELECYAATLPRADFEIRTIFFGGGTPSLLSPTAFATVFDSVRRHFALSSAAEITVEVNPASHGREEARAYFAALATLGVNRISVGAQGFSEEKLRFLGRLHSTADIYQTIEAIRTAGFRNISLDLIFGLAGETETSWSSDLTAALALQPQHLSTYALTIEHGSSFFARQLRGEQFNAEEELVARFYQQTQDVLSTAGFEQYEISNFALPGKECRHNLAYWERQEYLGLGAGAHSFLHDRESSPWGVRISNILAPDEYLAAVCATGHAQLMREDLSTEQAELEFVMLGLRMKKGISLPLYLELFGCRFEEQREAVIAEQTAKGLLEHNATDLRLTRQGMLFADSIITALCR